MPRLHLSLKKAKIHPVRPTRADLINAESALGRTIFGPVPAGHRREFFHDRENIWIWHEAWSEPTGRRVLQNGVWVNEEHERSLTVRYEVRETGVYKKVSAGAYYKLQGAELDNFRRATRTYLNLIKTHLYSH